MRGLGLATIVTAAGAILLGAVPAAASEWAAAPALAAAPGWRVVPSPPSDGGFFNAVSARTDTDAWAVGDLSATTPLTARWNGTALAPPPLPIHTGHKIITPRVPLLPPVRARYRRHPRPGGPPPPHSTARKPAGNG